MNHFSYKKGELYCEDVPVRSVAGEMGTPLYLYSHATLTKHFSAFDGAFKGTRHRTCFSVKSNSNLAIIKLFAELGSGMDIVSGGELYRSLKAGVEPQKIVFSGVGKTVEDLKYALDSEILMFNVESEQEILRLNDVAESCGKKARIAIRVNPDVDPETHPYISTGLKENKFGIDFASALKQYRVAAGLEHLLVSGVSCHIGSQLTQVRPFVDALKRLLSLVEELKSQGIPIEYLDLGGGLGITYDDESPPHPEKYAEAVTKELDGLDVTLILEPGRVIMGNAGVLVTKVIYAKTTVDKTFFVVDGAMNDLMRPSLYGSFHGIEPVVMSGKNKVKADVVGPICESGDFFAKERLMEPFEAGDFMAIMSAGAYGFSMASNYNSRPRPCELMVRGDRIHVIRERETFEDLVRGENIPDFLK